MSDDEEKSSVAGNVEPIATATAGIDHLSVLHQYQSTSTTSDDSALNEEGESKLESTGLALECDETLPSVLVVEESHHEPSSATGDEILPPQPTPNQKSVEPEGSNSKANDGAIASLLACHETIEPEENMSDGEMTKKQNSSVGVDEEGYDAALLLGRLSAAPSSTLFTGSQEKKSSLSASPRFRLPLNKNRQLSSESIAGDSNLFGDDSPDLGRGGGGSGRPPLMPSSPQGSRKQTKVIRRPKLPKLPINRPIPGRAVSKRDDDSSSDVTPRKRKRKQEILESDDDDEQSDDLMMIAPITPQTKRRAQNKSAPTESPHAAAAAALMHSSQYLAYSWDSLGLGTRLGTPALNEYVDRMSGGDGIHHKSKLTAQQSLQIVNTLRVKTCIPPPGSALHGVIQKSRFENARTRYSGLDDGKDSYRTKTGAPKIPLKQLAHLYESMCTQDADDGAATRRESHYLSAKACVQRMQSMENRICHLHLREADMIKRGKTLGLHPVPTSEMCQLEGYVTPNDDYGQKL